jgi:hypothetical protein
MIGLCSAISPVMATELNSAPELCTRFCWCWRASPARSSIFRCPASRPGPNSCAPLPRGQPDAWCCFSSWPKIDGAGPSSLGMLIGWMLAEAGIGIAVGLAVAFLTEGFQIGAQMISLQAGYSFATTIDPTSERRLRRCC